VEASPQLASRLNSAIPENAAYFGADPVPYMEIMTKISRPPDKKLKISGARARNVQYCCGKCPENCGEKGRTTGDFSS
jgi:hypothetical protein